MHCFQLEDTSPIEQPNPLLRDKQWICIDRNGFNEEQEGDDSY